MPRYDESAKAPLRRRRDRHNHSGGALAEVERTSYLSASERIKLRTAFENNYWSAELHRLRAVFLAAMGAEEIQIETSFSEAIRIAKEQKSISLEKHAEATCAEYLRQKASGSGGHGFRLPLW